MRLINFSLFRNHERAPVVNFSSDFDIFYWGWDALAKVKEGHLIEKKIERKECKEISLITSTWVRNSQSS